MAEYMNKEVFLSSMGLIGDETKYGNRDAEHQSRSYSRYMSYEIMDSVEDSTVEEELEPVKHGRWMPQILLGERVWDCSECKTIGSPVWKRCPVCEAKMDLEADHAEK